MSDHIDLDFRPAVTGYEYDAGIVETERVHTTNATAHDMLAINMAEEARRERDAQSIIDAEFHPDNSKAAIAKRAAAREAHNKRHAERHEREKRETAAFMLEMHIQTAASGLRSVESYLGKIEHADLHRNISSLSSLRDSMLAAIASIDRAATGT